MPWLLPLRGIYYATHVLRFTSFRFARRGAQREGREKRREREEEKRKNQDLGWRKMAVPMQTTRRAPRTSSGHWTGKWCHLRLWSSRAKVHAIADRRPTTATTTSGGRAFTTITENCDSARNSCFSTVSNGLSTPTIGADQTYAPRTRSKLASFPFY